MIITYRQIQPEDKEFLREMLFQAIFVLPGEGPYDRSILELPAISKYIDNWGRKDDFGIIVSLSGVPVGATWARLFDSDEKGFGFVDEDTPELTIAIKEEYRNKGLGKTLMGKFFQLAVEKGYSRVSLSVDKRNPAYRLYKKLGFVITGGTSQSPTMIKELMI
jgi:[ribosomal protein S18]-alanine N-acetyltransferase